MQIYRDAKRFDVQYQESTEIKDTKEDVWLKLDNGLKLIEEEWKKRMLTEQYLNEFVMKGVRIVNDVDDLTVEELKCWYRLLNIKLEDKCKMGDVYFKNETNHDATEIHVIHWIWTCNNEKYLLLDIYFKIKTNIGINEYGAIFLSNEIILVNEMKILYKTDNTSDELIKRISAFESVRK
jgi:hypothetical protein